ncbi:MAG: hypothetical protein Q9219_000870 [cf. Caloplaca sp. 3 TL-2023]
MENGRVKAFRMLKPPCVELSQVALRYKVNQKTAKDLLEGLEQLLETLQTVTRFLDHKLADYVFFPLSHIFGESKRLPSRVLELSLSCLRILIAQGWQSHLTPEIGKQLLVLLSFLAGGSATDAKTKAVNEDVGTVAFECTLSLFQSSVLSSFGSDGAISPEYIPLLGHAITVILDGVSNGPAVRVRLAACSALQALVSGIQDQEAIRSFFPGIVSCLTKVLASGMKSKTPFKVLEMGIRILDQTICKVLGDDTSATARHSPETSNGVQKVGRSWIDATSGQVKIALSTIVALRYHERQEVKNALFSFGVSTLTKCRKTLGNCAPLILETLVTISSFTPSENSVLYRGKLQQILAADPSLTELLREALYDWIVALPRVAESADEVKQRRTLDQLSAVLALLSAQNVDLKSFGDLLVSNLQSSITAMVRISSTSTISFVSDSSLEISRMLQSNALSKSTHSFNPILSRSTGLNNLMTGLQLLARQLQDYSMSGALQHKVARSLRAASNHEQIGSLWLMLQISEHTALSNQETDQWLNIPGYELDQIKEEAYAFALEILENSAYDDTIDWRLQALSLETVALQARCLAKEFRPELVDALYPILERMGSSNAALQQHAITCLSIVSDACGYPSASELVTDNADYLVNAVAVKLNTFDISPQASQVMLMMVRLCGSNLIPSLDDLIESIFAILACYHGYPRLVESLFEVLNAIVEEGGESDPKAIGFNQKPATNRRQPYQPTTIPDLIARLQDMRSKVDNPDFPPPLPSPEPEGEAPPLPASTTTTDDPSSPLSKTHSLIHTITLQTTHHLSTPSPTLRRLLLTLLTSALPTLASQTPTDSFLPLLATTYPHITRPLFYSSSSSSGTAPAQATATSDLPTCLAALTCLTTAFTSGGDFLLSRVEDDFPSLQSLYQTLERNFLLEETQLGRSRAARSMKYRCWDACVGLVLAMVEYVGITREMEDRVFEVLGGEALRRDRKGVRECLEGVNPDALWLLEEGRKEKEKGEDGTEQRWNTPVIEGWDFKDVEF